jgi:hypothetical protein
MKKYETPEIEVQRIEVEDVITTSDTLNDENLGEW